MTRDEFWALMEHVDLAALEEEDEEGALEPLLDELVKLEEEDLFEFEEHMAQCLFALDGQEWFDEAGENDTDDSFLYARAWVVAQGLKAWESVLEDPAQFPKSREQWCESLLYIASEAWAEVTGNPEDEWEFEASVSYETGSNEEQW